MRPLHCSLMIGAIVANTLVAHADLDPSLKDRIDAAAPDEIISVLVFMQSQGEVETLRQQHNLARSSLATRSRSVVRHLIDTAEPSQADLVARLIAEQAAGGVQRVQPLWIANAIRTDATPRVIEAVARRADVQSVYLNLPIEGTTPLDPGAGAGPDGGQAIGSNAAGGSADDDGGAAAAPTPGLVAIRAPQAWALGYTGAGQLMASLDSGVDGNHPAVGSRWRGLTPAYAGHPEWAWFDPLTNTSFPQEFVFTSHGTHTMGTAIGGAPGEDIGVAHGAQWIHAAVIDRVSVQQSISDAMLAFQWIVNPDGDPDSGFGVPDVCFNSWGIPNGFGTPPCDDLFWSFIDNVEAAGVVIVFAAGNEGAEGLRRPADRATSDTRTVAVAALNANYPAWPLASFSSTGPTTCTPSGIQAIKPEIAGPGVGVRSCVSGGGYVQYSGTSMATPHVAGVAALVRQACPELAPELVMQVIFDSAVDIGAPGKDNKFGYGMIDAEKAVLTAESFCSFGLAVPGGAPAFVPPGQPIVVQARIVQNGEALVPGSAKVFYRFNPASPFQSVPLVPIGLDRYAATLPSPVCGEVPEYYATATGSSGTVRFSPSNAPSTTFKTLVGGTTQVQLLAANFDSGLPNGWSLNSLWTVAATCAPSNSTCLTPSPTKFAYFGYPSFCEYDGPSFGTLQSPALAFPDVGALGNIVANFCYHQDAIAPGELSGGTFKSGSVTAPLSNTTSWKSKSVDLTPLSGLTAPLSWSFFCDIVWVEGHVGLMVAGVTVDATLFSCGGAPLTPGDLNGDGVVNGADLAMMLGAWGTPIGDVNGDGTTNGADLAVLLGNWG